jgi:hypothetical protein
MCILILGTWVIKSNEGFALGTIGAESASLQGVCSIRRHCYKGFAVGRWFQGGGLLIVDSMHITVENVYISHFETDGILGNSSLGTFQRSKVL